MTTVTEEQFEWKDRYLIHKPTGARFAPESDWVNWSHAGDVLPSGEDYDRAEIRRVAETIMNRKRP